jgi:oxalate decarboxylase/phosphoglucose isomerase-like protein (cupin superfamily)
VAIPGKGIRAPHLHTNASELSVIVKGTAIAYLINEVGERLEVVLEEGDCIYFPQNWPHWLVNTSEDTLVSYFNYSNEYPITKELPNIKMA